jgi:hypothetical protein
MRKRKKLLRVRVAIASGMLALFALPTAALAYPVEDGGQSKQGVCGSMDPLVRAMDARYCFDTRQVPSSDTNVQSVDTEPVPITSTSDDGGLALEWWVVAIGLVAAGTVGLIISLREGPKPLT